MASGNGTNLWHNWVGLAALNLGEWSGETQPGGCSVGTRAGAPRRGRMEEACARWQGTQICEKTSAVGQPCSTVRAIGGTVAGLARSGRNYCGHGFWQFSPELFFSLYSEKNGYSDTRIFLVSLDDWDTWYGWRLQRPQRIIDTPRQGPPRSIFYLLSKSSWPIVGFLISVPCGDIVRLLNVLMRERPAFGGCRHDQERRAPDAAKFAARTIRFHTFVPSIPVVQRNKKYASVAVAVLL